MQEVSIAMIIDGKKISENILSEIRKEIEKKQLKLKLAAVLVGDDYASRIYVRKKQEACEKVGIAFELFNFPKDITQKMLKEEVRKIAEDPDVSGIIVQLPVPKGISADEVMKAIPDRKNVEKISPVVCAVQRILDDYDISLENKTIVLVGRGKLVGGPLSDWLDKKGEKFFGIERIKDADVVISGVGKPKLITKDMVKDGVVVIDVGFSHDKDKKAVGDVDFKEVAEKASLITPVPGGVGPITVACLLRNLLQRMK